jgi:thermitase
LRLGPLWTVSRRGMVSDVDTPQQVNSLSELVDHALRALGPVHVHDPEGPNECLVRSGEIVVPPADAPTVRKRLRGVYSHEEISSGAIRMFLKASERARVVDIAAEVGATPNHVHLSCPIMIGTSRPVVGEHLPELLGEGTVALLDTPLDAPHGSLVAGVLRHHGATVRPFPVLSASGFGDDLTLAATLRATRSLPVVLVASGTYTFNDECPPVLASYGHNVVAAAGNGGSSRPWWPAALPSVTAVGASAPFSGHGPWVDVVVDGVDIPATVGSTQSLCTGTSFAAALHAATLVPVP